MRRMGPALLGSIALHLAVVGLALLRWGGEPETLKVSSVPVQIIAEMPTQARAPAPVDERAVLPPEPEPVPEPAPAPEPEPEPEPAPAPKPEPVPAPKPQPAPKPAPKPEPAKPAPKPAAPAKPEPKKPEPKKPAASGLDLDSLSRTPSTPPRSRTLARPSPTASQGASNRGADAQDTGPALNALTSRLQRLWSPNCDVPGANTVKITVGFTISPAGRVIKGPEWIDKRNDRVWEAAAARAQLAVKRGELYEGLPDGLYNQPLEITFNAEKACQGL